MIKEKELPLFSNNSSNDTESNSKFNNVARQKTYIKLYFLGGGGEIQQLKALNAPPEDLGPKKQLTTSSDSSSKVSDTLFWLRQTLHAHGT